jgi:hypothetical protein
MDVVEGFVIVFDDLGLEMMFGNLDLSGVRFDGFGYPNPNPNHVSR